MFCICCIFCNTYCLGSLTGIIDTLFTHSVCPLRLYSLPQVSKRTYAATYEDHLGPKILDTKIIHTSGKVFDLGVEQFRFWGTKNVQKYFKSMFPYTEKYTESEHDI